MATQARRDHLHRQLASDHRGLQSVSRSDAPHVDLMEILTAAYDYPGAMRALWETIKFLYVDDVRLPAIKDLIDAIEPEDLLEDAEQQSVLGLLAPADQAVIARAFHYSTRMTVQEAGLDPQDVTAVAKRVQDYPGRPDRLPPFFDFVDYVAHCSKSTGAALHKWMDQVSNRLGFTDRAAVDKLCYTTDHRLATNGRFYLVAELRPDKLSTDRFFLAAWRQCGDEPEEALYSADRSVRWEEAITSAHDLMRALTVDVATTAEERVLEFITPRCLVTQSIDQWQVGTVLPAAIGTWYPLVLRSFERLDDPSLHSDWARNWRWLKLHDRVAGVEAIREVESHDLATVQALRGALLQEGAPAVVCMLTALPVSDVLATDAYTAGLHGGAPIMVWSRDDSATVELAASVRVACVDSVLGLREHVFQLRLRALDESNGPPTGAHITLVYDDFDRLPERYRNRAQLRSPELQRSGAA